MSSWRHIEAVGTTCSTTRREGRGSQLSGRHRANGSRRSCAICSGSRELVDSVDAIIWKGDARPLRFTLAIRRRLSWDPVEALDGGASFWHDHIHPEDREWAASRTCQGDRR